MSIKTRVVLVSAVMFVSGCAITPLPEDAPSSPASPHASESTQPRVRSALRPDETSHAIAARLREVRSATTAPTHGEMRSGSEPITPAINRAAHSYHTCPMHPEIQQNRPGKCPKCGMDLVLKEGEPPK